ncbi:MAG TPA: transcription elongation factor Spt5 [Candidatus Woesearchaeota archaeon]|nr:transcription elongation factor Spt5 [Candidatus Woesearchaeota archaeon]
MAIFAVRTTTGRENQVIEKIKTKVKKEGLDVYAVLKPREVKGYFFVEAESADEIAKSTYGVLHAKGVVGEVNISEIEHFLIPTIETIKINTGDIVEIVSGPFKGEKATVKRITKVKEEVVVELLEAAVPIPITVKLDSVRVIRTEEQKKKEEG